MKFTETKLQGVYIVKPERIKDVRGFFAPSFSQREFEERELASRFVESNISFNKRRGTLRGLHYQAPPHGQAKLVRCTRGAIFDVAVDLRRDSETFRQWVGVKLTEENRLMLYVPGELAHGYQTLVDKTEVFYEVSEFYDHDSSRGLRWDDPAFRIKWPDVGDRILIGRDRNYPDFEF